MEAVQDPSFEFPFDQRPNQDRLYFTNEVPGQIETITRTWIGTEDEERVLGRKLLQINGDGGLAIWFPMGPTVSQPFSYPASSVTLGHYVTVRAKSVGSGGSVFGINYFDANFDFIKQELMPINGSSAGTSRGIGDLLKSYTLPVRVPTNARFGQVWIANVSTESREAQDTTIGGTLTFDFLSVFSEPRTELNDSGNPAPNEIRNGLFNIVGDSRDFQTTGFEFWNLLPGSRPGVDVDFREGEINTTLNLGQPGKVTNLYEVMYLLPNQNYQMSLLGNSRSTPSSVPANRAWFGIDYFDLSGSKIGDVVYDIGQQVFAQDIIAPPTKTDFAIAWFYVEPQLGRELVEVEALSISKVNFNAARVSAATRLRNKRTRSKAPASPITKAIALKAREATQANAANSNTTPMLKTPN